MPRPAFPTAEPQAKAGYQAAWAWTAALLIVSGGCHGAAYREVYQQKMASEIRVLEDQLYEADYQNQVLRDELTRLEIKASQVYVPQSSSRRTLFGKPSTDADEVVDVPEPDRSPTLPARPLDSPRNASPRQDRRPLPAAPLSQELDSEPSVVPRGEPGQSPLPARSLEDRFTPPSEPVPPGAEDLMVPDVELGDPVPPPAAEGATETPPGKITVPDSAKRLSNEPPREPVAIRVNTSLSGGYKTDDEPPVEGVALAIEAIDDQGTVVKLEQFDIDAELSVVLLDPSRSADTARLGKWDFGPAEIREMIRGDLSPSLPGSGLNVMIPWQDLRPQSSKVIAHIRLGAGETVMQTQAEIATEQPNMAQWTPRAAVPSRR
ncbi:MAG: hypothetical protein ACO1RT_04495 [Planctomycetaceae bacterium]